MEPFVLKDKGKAIKVTPGGGQSDHLYFYIDVTIDGTTKRFKRTDKEQELYFRYNNSLYYLTFQTSDPQPIKTQEQYGKQHSLNYLFTGAHNTFPDLITGVQNFNSPSVGDLLSFTPKSIPHKTTSVFVAKPEHADYVVTCDDAGVITLQSKDGSEKITLGEIPDNADAVVIQPIPDGLNKKTTAIILDENGSGYTVSEATGTITQPNPTVPKQETSQSSPSAVGAPPRAPITLPDGTVVQGEIQTKSLENVNKSEGGRNVFKPPTNAQPLVTPGAANPPITGVGGELIFKIGVPNAEKNGFSDAFGYKPVSIELAPARQSFFDKQGQRVPGAGGGMEFRSRANLVKLNVPGSRPIYQHMGIAEETIEWVGAFVGFDHPDETQENADHAKREVDAWRSSYEILKEMQKGQELMLEMSWIDLSLKKSQSHSIKFSESVFYRGFIKDLKRTYATAQRVYYYVCFCITNREDLELFTEDSVPVALPSGSSSITSTVTPEQPPSGGTTAEQPTPEDETTLKPGYNSFSTVKEALKIFNTNLRSSNANPLEKLLPSLAKFDKTFSYDKNKLNSNENAEAASKLLNNTFKEITEKASTINQQGLTDEWIKNLLKEKQGEQNPYSLTNVVNLREFLTDVETSYLSYIAADKNNKINQEQYKSEVKRIKNIFQVYLTKGQKIQTEREIGASKGIPAK